MTITAHQRKACFALRRSAIQGQGAFATRLIRKGTRIVEYAGERVSNEEADRRYDDDAMGRHHTFLFSVDEDTSIDGAVNGNEAAYINHSCDPNCEAIADDGHIYIHAIAKIEAGDELTYDYRYARQGTSDREAKLLYPCRCGAASCRGTILAPKENKRKYDRRFNKKKKKSEKSAEPEAKKKASVGAKKGAKKKGAKKGAKTSAKKKGAKKRGAKKRGAKR